MTLPVVYTLDNGFRFVLEQIPSASSVCAGLWLGHGSRHETSLESGMTHFAEHLLFKGTESMHWQTIAKRINLLGGHFNAYTSTDCVKIYGHFIRRDIREALTLMSEMFLRSTFPKEEVEREREVILEEIAQYEDVPDDLCYERFTQALLQPHSLGRPVIGSTSLVESFTRDDVYNFWTERLSPSRMILSIAGNFETDEVRELANDLFGALRLSPVPYVGMDAPVGKHDKLLIDRDLEQVNFAFGVTGPVRRQEARFAWSLYDCILGGGMGSRLFDEVREKRGLAYSIGSSITTMHDAGYLMVAGSTRPDSASTAIAICREQLALLASHGPTDDELSTAKRQLERSHLLSRESFGVRAGLNGERILYDLEVLTDEEIVRRLYAVTKEEVRAVGEQVTSFGEPALCVVGPLQNAPGLG